MNDAADAAAGNACNSEIASHDAVPLSRKCALARLRRVLWSNWSASAISSNSQYMQWLDGRRAPPPAGLSRRAEVEIRRLRTGHHALLRTYISRSVWRVATPEERNSKVRNCPLCSDKASLQHLLLECPGGEAPRLRLTLLKRGISSWSVTDPKPDQIVKELLFRKPALALDYLQQAGLLDKFTVTRVNPC